MAVNYLVFDDGTVVEGVAFGKEGDSAGEIVFTTSTDYQDSLTDPSNKGNILIFTYPLFGDYGVEKDYQSSDVYPCGVVVREYCKEPSEQYKGEEIDAFLKRKGIVGISGIDTRSLVIKIREHGTFRGAIVDSRDKAEKILKSMRSDEDLVSQVTAKEIIKKDNKKGLSLGILDCGIRRTYIDELSQRFDLTVFPAGTPADKIASSGVKGVLVSDGPGDPSKAESIIATVKELSSKLPVMGIGFGACIIAEAFGAKTYKMKFGHRGGQSVEHENRVLITTQNRGYAIDAASAEKAGFVVDQINLNDRTVEGIRHSKKPAIATEYHPEVLEGAINTSFVYDSFEAMMRGVKQ